MRHFFLIITAATLVLVGSHSLLAQSVQAPAADNSVEAELASFELEEGYEIALFADETDGIANPVCIHWDAAGRLWVLCTWAYPQLDPTEEPDDKLLILEDTDGDGRADKTIVYVDKLNMPTGFALGDGGVYLGQGADLLFFQDTDGDDHADTQQVLFSGFGTGDTHQNINSFTWSPGGELLFCQGLHAFSRVETPWGIVRADSAGMWSLRPKQQRLRTFLTPNRCYNNPWGIGIGRWGEIYLKSNDPGLVYASPAMIETTNAQSPLRFYGEITRTVSKSMIIEIVETNHLPEELQGHGLIAEYFAHKISMVSLVDSGAGIAKARTQIFLNSTHNSFRPVDIRIGPDGAIYVADWFNPIIGHYQASFRHPDRDTIHGRIWRIVATDRPLVEMPHLTEMTADQLCKQLESSERWNRYHAKRLLAELSADEALPAVERWLGRLDENDPKFAHHLYEAIGLFEWQEQVNQPLLERLMQSNEPRARAYAARVIGRWHDRLESPLALLDRCVTDEHPRVRMEAIVACSRIPAADSVVVATRAASLPIDPFIEYSLTQTIHALSEYWLPELQADRLAFSQPEHLIYTLTAFGGNDVAAQVRQLIQQVSAAGQNHSQLLGLLARVGNSDDLRYVFNLSLDRPELLQMLVEVSQVRNVIPSGEIHDSLAGQLGSDSPEIRLAAARLVGLWNIQQHVEAIKNLVDATEEQAEVRVAAILSLGELSPDESMQRFDQWIAPSVSSSIRLAAIKAVAPHDPDRAMNSGLAMINESDNEEDISAILTTLMQRRGSVESMTKALRRVDISTDAAKLISRWLSAAGYDDDELIAAMYVALDIKPGQPIAYSEEFVADLLREVTESGDPQAGHQVFSSSLTNCTACHQVGNTEQGVSEFFKGPSLLAVGAGLQPELIVEAIVWPERQLKEGYESTTLLLDDGKIFNGYLVNENDQTVVLRELATGELLEVATNAIDERVVRGTIMPAGFTTTLTRHELRDLVAFLTSLKGTVEDEEPEFLDLFDGQTLTGWEGNEEFFRVQDGVIVAGSLEDRIPHNAFLCTNEEYGDFELRLEARVVGEGQNGGVQIRSQRIPNHHEVRGYQSDVGSSADRTIWGSLYDESRRGLLDDGGDHEEVTEVVNAGGWNEMIVRCEGPRIQIWINGFQTVDYTEENEDIPRTGIIGLQIHGGSPAEVSYRNIRIHSLAAEE